MADEPKDKDFGKLGEQLAKGIQKGMNIGAAAGGAVKGTANAIKTLAPSGFTFLVILAILGSAYDYFFGGYLSAPFSPGPLFVDALIYASFAIVTRSMLGVPLLIFLVERFAPFISGALASSIPDAAVKIVAGLLIIAPYWLIYCFLLSLSGQGKSSLATFILWIAFVFTLLLFLVNINPVFGDYKYVINQKAVDEAKDFLSNSFEQMSTNVKKFFCEIRGDTVCLEEFKKQAEGDVLEKTMNIKAIPDSGFSMKISEFVTENQAIYDNQQAIQIEAVNNVNRKVDIGFMCGFEKQGAGIPDPAILTLNKGRLSFQDGTIMCKDLNLDVKKKTLASFYFNATAKNIISTGEKVMLIMDKNAKEAVVSKYPGVSENRILLLSKEFGDYLQTMQGELGARVSEDDMLQPVIVAGAITSAESKQILIYGVGKDDDEKEVEIPFALFVKNNGPGKIIKINNIKLDTPQGLYFDEDNCGVNIEELSKKNWASIAKDKFAMVVSCKLKFLEAQYPNNPEPKTVSVSVDYDYMISKAQNVYITTNTDVIEVTS